MKKLFKWLFRLFLVLVLLIVLLTTGNLVFAQSAEAPKAAGKMVNINTAGQSELESLPGIGPSLAKRILEFREKNGNFKTPNDLIAVQGIGEQKFEQLKSLITVK